ncbi:hypothetical protein BD310DRAFT_509795 [Dichomitus squalens]|uniref:Uncharacterized protein n=1 Tax=Dichomitus squalens TaxID=114155 RepID=A0A4Q9PTZ3_9APHY|nr:hypothetical protein BD310DRAFT_509795 [Dichomitus squalens]
MLTGVTGTSRSYFIPVEVCTYVPDDSIRLFLSCCSNVSIACPMAFLFFCVHLTLSGFCLCIYGRLYLFVISIIAFVALDKGTKTRASSRST